MRCVTLLTVPLVFMAALIFAQPTPVSAKPIVLKAISAFPKNHPHNLGIPGFIALVERKSKGQLKINWLGGPEVVKTFDQGEALKNGMVDMLLYNPFGYFKPFSPVFQAKGLSQLTAWEERTVGAYALWVKIFREKVNAEYLGSFNSMIPFRIYCNKKISGIADFKGMKIRVMPLYIPFVKALGAKAITIPPMEIYTAMQRGVVDGFMWPNYAIPGMGWHEVTKYAITPGVFSIEPATLVNLDKFNSLPKNLQEVLNLCMEIMEGIDTARSLVRVNHDWKIMQAAGMKEIVLPPTDAKNFFDLAYDVTWKSVIKHTPVYGSQLKKLSSK